MNRERLEKHANNIAKAVVDFLFEYSNPAISTQATVKPVTPPTPPTPPTPQNKPEPKPAVSFPGKTYVSAQMPQKNEKIKFNNEEYVVTSITTERNFNARKKGAQGRPNEFLWVKA